MCGIVGYIGNRPAQTILVSGLEKLEYRGYDSAGVATVNEGKLDCVRAKGKLYNLREKVELVTKLSMFLDSCLRLTNLTIDFLVLVSRSTIPKLLSNNRYFLSEVWGNLL